MSIRYSSFQIRRSPCLAMLTAIAAGMLCCLTPCSRADSAPEDSLPKLVRIVNDTTALVSEATGVRALPPGGRAGAWYFMGVAHGEQKYAVFEDFRDLEGTVAFIPLDGPPLLFPKTAESNVENSAELYLGHSKEELAASPDDLLGEAILGRPTDPAYRAVAGVLPKMEVAEDSNWSTTKLLEAFVGTPQTSDKLWVMAGGRTANLDPAQYEPSIANVRRKGAVRQGLVGGYLPAIRFVYPEAPDTWTECLIYAPFRVVNGNDRVQPVWYRITRIESNVLRSVRYIDSYLPFPYESRKAASVESEARFYDDFIRFAAAWEGRLHAGMQITLPDKRVENMARFSIVQSMLSRAGQFPKYGISEGEYALAGTPGYGGSQHDGFPDTLTAEAGALLDWGLIEPAGQYLDNYLTQYVREDGRLLYRGPEVGQYGQILTVIARYLDAGGNTRVILKNDTKILGIVSLLRDMRARALGLSKDDPARGMLAGWSEADSALWPEPSRYTQPYFSNTLLVARGFRDLGRSWVALGRRARKASMSSEGANLIREGLALEQDAMTSIARSTIPADGSPLIPSIAGAKSDPAQAVARDPGDPQWPYYRVYMEMLGSGLLAPEQAQSIQSYIAHHHGLMLGLPAGLSDGKLTTFGFLSTGLASSLVQTDRIRKALLMLYSAMAHQYSRGTWIAPEERDPLAPGWWGYSAAAQVTIAEIVRWLLIFEDPQSATVWLAKGAPTEWFEDGSTLAVTNARTKWGKISFSVESHTRDGYIRIKVNFPPQGFRAVTRLRLRALENNGIKAVTSDGRPWNDVDRQHAEIVFPKGMHGTANILVNILARIG